MTTLIVVTPLCGLLFQCGCDWPWSGLDVRCNFNKPESELRCPWCASGITGVFSTGFAIMSGVLTPVILTLPFARQRPAIAVTARILSGLTVFVMVAIVCAGLAALWQHYPLGIGKFEF